MGSVSRDDRGQRPRGDDSGDDEQSEVVTFCRDLVRIDTSNPGALERPAAEYVAARLSEAGLDPAVLEGTPGRTNVVVRVPGRDPTRDALLIHGHLDVVPAGDEQWRFPPFSGEVVDGCVFGRGSVDMKGPVAMVLATVRKRLAENRLPARDLILAFVADEERGSRHGSQFLVEQHPDLFERCSEGIGEVGGFSTRIAGRRAYLLQTAERGVAWTRLKARGTSSHGSLQTTANPVAALARTLAAIVSAPTPQRTTETNRALLAGLARLVGERPAESGDSGRGSDGGDSGAGAERLLDHLGPVRRIVSSGLRNTMNPTVLEAGSSPNVVPSEAAAIVDGRFLAGHEAALDNLLGECCAPGVTAEELFRSAAVESPPDGALYDAMTSALLAEDPDGVVLPFTWPGFTDAKQFARLGIACYGFLPLRLPDEYDFPAMFHGLDERVPVESLHFGTRVLDHLLDHA